MRAKLPGCRYPGVAARRAQGGADAQVQLQLKLNRGDPIHYEFTLVSAVTTTEQPVHEAMSHEAATENGQTPFGPRRVTGSIPVPPIQLIPFRRDCSQDCSQGAEQQPTHVDNSGISAQPTTTDGRSWTTCPLLRVRRLGVRVPPSAPRVNSVVAPLSAC